MQIECSHPVKNLNNHVISIHVEIPERKVDPLDRFPHPRDKLDFIFSSLKRPPPGNGTAIFNLTDQYVSPRMFQNAAKRTYLFILHFYPKLINRRKKKTIWTFTDENNNEEMILRTPVKVANGVEPLKAIQIWNWKIQIAWRSI